MGDLGLIPGWEDLLEMEMATHSSILAWKIPRTEEPGRLQSMGSQSRTRLSNLPTYLTKKVKKKEREREREHKEQDSRAEGCLCHYQDCPAQASQSAAILT